MTNQFVVSSHHILNFTQQVPETCRSTIAIWQDIVPSQRTIDTIGFNGRIAFPLASHVLQKQASGDHNYHQAVLVPPRGTDSLGTPP